MVALVTVQEVRERLHIDAPDDDADIHAMAEQASEIVVDYIKRPDHAWTDQTVPSLVKAAVLLIIGAMYADREGSGPLADLLGALHLNDRNSPVVGILYRFRDPAFA